MRSRCTTAQPCATRAREEWQKRSLPAAARRSQTNRGEHLASCNIKIPIREYTYSCTKYNNTLYVYAERERATGACARVSSGGAYDDRRSRSSREKDGYTASQLPRRRGLGNEVTPFRSRESKNTHTRARL